MVKYFLLFFTLVLFFGFSVLTDSQNQSQNQNPNNNIGDEISNSTKLQCPSPPPFDKQISSRDKANTSTSTAVGAGYDKAIENITNEEYNISYNEDLNSYQSPNRSNNIRFIYYNDGFTAKTRENKIPLFDVSDKKLRSGDKKYETIKDWEIRFKMLELRSGISGAAYKFDGNEFKVDKNKASIEDKNMRIDYTNNQQGMRQNFFIKNKPDGEGGLRLDLSAETKLNSKINQDGLLFKDKNGIEKMKYSDLKVWDANGKSLFSYFEKNEDQSSKISKQLFSIVVRDEEAVYPITIDPISVIPNWTAESNQVNAGFGYSVSSAGDVNGDGFSDVIIGAPFYDNGLVSEGKAFVYLGSSAGLLPVATWSAHGNQANAQFGWSVSTAGDVNHDGYSDVIVGASYYSNGQSYEGRAFVYYGSILGLSFTANWTGESNQANAQFGWAVSTAGDINHDGYSDVIVGAPLYDNVYTDEGRVFIYYGSATGLSANVGATIDGNQATAFFGYSVSKAGDVNGDSFADILVGSNRFDNPLRDEGAAFIFYGSAAGISSTINWRSDSHPQSWFAYLGNSVSSAGDVNGDGYSDVIVGAYAFDDGETDEGKVFVYYGSPTGLSMTANWTAESNQPYAYFGSSVACAGDVNGDGYSDVIIGAKQYHNGETNEGGAFIYYGSSQGLSSSPNWTAESNQANAYYGISVSSAGDVNGDGLSDVIVGAYLYDNGQTDEGAAFVYYGVASTPKTLNLTMFIQGFYNPNSNTMIQDTVRIYLRNVTFPYAIVDSAKKYLSTSGSGAFIFFNASNSVNYYLQIKHRNAIETWSATGKSFTNNVLNYNLSTSLSQAYGNNMIRIDQSPLRYGLFEGDVNKDGAVDLSDNQKIENDAFLFISGYVASDCNGDNFVDVSDESIADNNEFNYVYSIRP